MRFFFCVLLCFCFLLNNTNAQTNLQIGYQEFPTTVLGHASDAEGNMYYTGHFKGNLIVNGVTLAQGAGLEDQFWVTTSPAGQVIRYKTFSSPNSDQAWTDGLAMGSNEQMYFISWTRDDMQFDNHHVPAYATNGGKFVNTITRIDTAGNIKWVRRTNLNLVKVLSADNLVHVVGRVNSGIVKSEDSTVLDAVNKPGLVYMIYDTSGKFIGHKFIAGNDASQTFDLQKLHLYSDGSLLFSFRLLGNNSFQVNNQTVALSPTFSQYHVLLRADTSFTHIRTKILHHPSTTLYGGSTTTLAADLSANDSLYAVLHLSDGFSYSIDGFNIPVMQNMLVVFDSTLAVKRTASLGTSFVAHHNLGIIKRKFYFRSVTAIDNNLFLTGQYLGINEAPMNPVAPFIIPRTVLGNASTNIDVNGPSQTYVGRISLDLAKSKLEWIGSHLEYESGTLYPTIWHKANKSRFVFLMNKDNIWNPWVVDTSLTVVSGAMRRNADRPEMPQLVSFLPDGSKVVLLYASGKTSLDTSITTPSSALRQDIFLSNFNPNGSVRWYHRIQSTLFQPSGKKLIAKNGKAWFLANFAGSQNDANFITVNNQTFAVNVNSSLLCSINPNGDITPINLPNDTYKNGIIADFAFFSNGDLALLVNTSFPVNIPGFASGPGFFILRVNPADGALLDARKLSGVVSPTVSCLEIDANDNIYVSVGVNIYSTANTTLNLYNGSTVVDAIALTNVTDGIPHVGMLKLSWNKLHWAKRFYGNASTSAVVNNLFLLNNKPVFCVRSPANNSSLFWGSQPVHNGTTVSFPLLLALDSNGDLVRAKTIPLASIRKATNSEHLYVSGGLSSPMQIDTIQIGNAGGTDGVSLVLDSNFIAKQCFRVGTDLTELSYDMDIFQDSVVAITYYAQKTPAIFSNRTMVQSSDYDPNAYITTIPIRTGQILPVHWLAFTASKQNEASAFLHWKVADQIGNEYFEVEHSTDNRNYKKLTRISSLSVQTDYTYLHTQPDVNGINYYRIKQVDKNGSYGYSPVRAVGFSRNDIVKVSPNPASDVVRVSTNNSELTIHLYDNLGKKQLTENVSSGNVEMDISSLPNGMYILVVYSNGTHLASHKIIKQ